MCCRVYTRDCFQASSQSLRGGAPAIIGGCYEVVEFLLETRRYNWDYAEALEVAVDARRDAIAELIFAQSMQLKDTNLLRFFLRAAT